MTRISKQKAHQVRENTGSWVDRSMVQNGMNLQVDEDSLALRSTTSVIYVKQNEYLVSKLQFARAWVNSGRPEHVILKLIKMPTEAVVAGKIPCINICRKMHCNRGVIHEREKVEPDQTKSNQRQ